MKLANATNLNRKSGGAQWRDLRFLPPPHTPTPNPNILPILIAQPNLASRVSPSLREFLEDKIQSAGGASNLLS
jgi:hypothetical protein